MRWNVKTKEQIQYAFSTVAFIFGMVLVGVSCFAIEPLGIVDATIITIFGLVLSFVGAVFGINMHFDNELSKFKTEIRTEFEEEKRSLHRTNNASNEDIQED